MGGGHESRCVGRLYGADGAVPYRRFGTTNRSNLCTEQETSVTNYHYSLRNNPEESSSQNGQLQGEW